MQFKKFALVFAMAGMSLTLVGAGLTAVFTDTGTVSQTVSVGTFGIELSSGSAGCTAVNTHSITCTVPTITTSTGSAPFSFVVSNPNDIPVSVVVSSSTTLPTGWSSVGDPVPTTPVTLNKNDIHTYSAGLAWTDLGNGDLGTSVSITYDVAATA